MAALAACVALAWSVVTPAPYAEAALAAVAGQVTDVRGEPLADIDVLLEPTASTATPYQFLTRQDGRYVFPAVAPGQYSLTFVDRGQIAPDEFGYASTRWTQPGAGSTIFGPDTLIQLGDSADRTFDIALEQNAIVTGVLTDAVTGAPLPFVNIEATGAGNGAWHSIFTDSTGRYSFRAAEGTMTLVPSSSSGYVAADPSGVLVSARWGERTDATDLVVRRGAAVTGRVVDAATGMPVRDVLVQAVARGSSGPAPAARSVWTDGLGEYGFASLRGDEQIEVRIGTSAAVLSYAQPEAVTVDVRWDAPQVVDVALVAGATIRLSGVDAGGEPTALSSAQIRKVQADGSLGTAVFDGASLGEISFPRLQPGTYEVVAEFMEIGTSDPTRVTVGVGESRSLTLARGTSTQPTPMATISGVVTDVSTDLPIAGALVGIEAADGTHGTTLETSASGTFRTDMPAGDYIVSYTADGFEPQWWNGSATLADAFVLTLPPNQRIGGVNALMDPVGWVPPEPLDSDGDGISDADELLFGSDPLVSETFPHVTRFGGADRFAAAVSISRFATQPGSPLFLVNGLNFPDALAAGPAASTVGGGVLMVQPGVLPSVVAEEIRRVDPSEVFVIGGPNSVSNAVMAQAGQIAGVTPERISGADRFEVAVNVANRFFPGQQDRVLLANGLNFPDALGLASAGSMPDAQAPVLLTTPASLPASVRSAIDRMDPSEVVVAGGVNSVNASQIPTIRAAAAPGAAIERLAGPDRFAVSAAIAAYFAPNQPTTPAIFASGFNFPDALVGSMLTGRTGAPLLLMSPQCQYSPTLGLDPQIGAQYRYIAGGPNSVNEGAIGRAC